MTIRQARVDDVQACVALIEACRLTYQGYQPRFWHKAADSGAMSAGWYTQLFARDDVIALVAETDDQVRGFLVAAPYPVPPVYDPGGPNALIDDFAVQRGLWDTIGRALLAEARIRLRSLGFAQVVVVSARQDAEKSALLDATDLSLASTWWTAQP